jgi:5-methylcytosine-specific restriction endonuclease McrA
MTPRKGMAKTYSEKLRDPRWQKKRLLILDRDEWCCQQCFDGDSTLHVHHRRYRTGAEPWEYEDADLVTLCETCHAKEGRTRKAAETRLLEALRRRFLAPEIDTLAEAFERMSIYHIDEVVAGAIAWSITDPESHTEAIAHYLASRSHART